MRVREMDGFAPHCQLRFDFCPLRFEFLARETVSFAPGKAANTLRGTLGMVFRQIACAPQCRGASTCEMRATCPYARVFEPSMRNLESDQSPSPSGLSDWPRPFVFRARHLDG